MIYINLGAINTILYNYQKLTYANKITVYENMVFVIDILKCHTCEVTSSSTVVNCVGETICPAEARQCVTSYSTDGAIFTIIKG